MKESLSPRLLCVANLVRQGAVLADVGTDHAYLPLFLLSVGHIDRAICSDINEGPLCSARENAREMGKSENITFLLTNGLTGIMAHNPTDIAICGMGGELIAGILRDAPEAHRKGLRFLLQPMTRQEHLRKTLFSLGFVIVREEYVTEGDKTYLIIVAEYTGEPITFGERECLLGTRVWSGEPMTSAEKRYFKNKEKALLRRRDGRTKAGECTTEEDVLLSYLAPYTKE
jgi:tRNA (adenine22-N1)-methyltransferase